MRLPFHPSRAVALFLGAALATLPAWAEKPDHAGGGKHKADKHEQKADKHERKAEKFEQKAEKHERKADKQERKAERHASRDDDRRGPRPGAYFDDRHRDAVRHYYTSYDGRRCPPGLAKKNNGCMPPGQAKKWDVGQRLPRDVVIYSVPQPILVTLPPPPPQHRYVRVAGDILLIAIGTQMVIDGISGLY
jgi:Ni/Co efflux regulator RcnB